MAFWTTWCSLQSEGSQHASRSLPGPRPSLRGSGSSFVCPRVLSWCGLAYWRFMLQTYIWASKREERHDKFNFKNFLSLSHTTAPRMRWIHSPFLRFPPRVLAKPKFGHLTVLLTFATQFCGIPMAKRSGHLLPCLGLLRSHSRFGWCGCPALAAANQSSYLMSWPPRASIHIARAYGCCPQSGCLRPPLESWSTCHPASGLKKPNHEHSLQSSAEGCSRASLEGNLVAYEFWQMNSVLVSSLGLCWAPLIAASFSADGAAGLPILQLKATTVVNCRIPLWLSVLQRAASEMDAPLTFSKRHRLTSCPRKSDFWSASEMCQVRNGFGVSFSDTPFLAGV